MLTIPEKKAILFGADLVVVVILAAAALLLTAFLSPYNATEELVPQGASILGLGMALLVIGYLNETLDITSMRGDGVFLRRWAQAWAAGVGIFAAAYFFVAVPWSAESFSAVKITRFAPIIFALLMLFFLPLARWGIAGALGFDRVRRKCVVAGAGRAAAEFISTNSVNHGEWDIVGLVDDDPHKTGTRLDGCEVLAGLEQLPEVASRCRASDIILAIASPLAKNSLDGVLKCFENGMEILPVDQAIERTAGRVPIHSLGEKWLPSTFWATTDTPLLQRALKRCSDLVASVLVLLLLSPLVLTALLLSVVLQGFPVLYRQQRVGKGGKAFTLTKLRSMRRDAEIGGAQWADRNDPRVTPFGRFLRATRLDEVPQLWNIMKGDMSLVGPRPERPEFVALLEEKIPFYRARLAVKPGLTGWAQVKLGYTSDVDDARTKLEYDLYYVKKRSFWLDLVILGKTAKTVLTLRGR